jgi:hypothetical protein
MYDAMQVQRTRVSHFTSIRPKSISSSFRRSTMDRMVFFITPLRCLLVRQNSIKLTRKRHDKITINLICVDFLHCLRFDCRPLFRPISSVRPLRKVTKNKRKNKPGEGQSKTIAQKLIEACNDRLLCPSSALVFLLFRLLKVKNKSQSQSPTTCGQ